MGSENPTGADNQQETTCLLDALDPGWVTGFVDGEGSFCVSVHRNSMMHRHGGWQIQASFHVYQHSDHRDVLEALNSFFGCGRIRSKGPKSSVLTFVVEGTRDLEAAVLPFFCRHPLIVKRDDFDVFAEIVRRMRVKEHLTQAGFERIVRLAYGMNALGKQRARTIDQILGGSSETARGAPLMLAGKIQSDPHGDMRS